MEEYNKSKKELDEKIEKDIDKKYKDNPLYKKMMKAKKKYEEFMKKYSQLLKKLLGEYGGNWNEMTDEQKADYMKKSKELQKKYRALYDAYKKAKKAFEDSIKNADDAKFKDNPYYQKIIALKAKLAEIQKAYYAYMKEAGTEYENMNEEERAEYRKKLADFREQIEKLKKAMAEATEEFEKSKNEPK
ncbi:MAG: hypothetical protein K8S87_03950 [Planctomycetes bacterium]|nr:hypothetical protein [Planctomycetota bacterium]